MLKLAMILACQVHHEPMPEWLERLTPDQKVLSSIPLTAFEPIMTGTSNQLHAGLDLLLLLGGGREQGQERGVGPMKQPLPPRTTWDFGFLGVGEPQPPGSICGAAGASGRAKKTHRLKICSISVHARCNDYE